MIRWASCCVPGCENQGTVRYERLERGAQGKGTGSRRRRYLCGSHDFVLRKAWDDLWKLLLLKHPQTMVGIDLATNEATFVKVHQHGDVIHIDRIEYATPEQAAKELAYMARLMGK